MHVNLQLLNPDGLDVDVFVSHFWGHPFERTVRSLSNFAESVYKVKLSILPYTDSPKVKSGWVNHACVDAVPAGPRQGKP